MSEIFFEVAVNAPLSQKLTYADNSNLSIHPGCFVEVPLGNRKSTGVILGLSEKPKDIQAKTIYNLVKDTPILNKKFLHWSQWLSQYYHHPLGQVLHLAKPPLKKHTNRTSKKPPVVPTLSLSEAPPLMNEQQAAIEGIEQQNGFSTHLLYGVTGSGKTEVYLHLIKKILKENKQVLVLVPEISLTPQLIHRFSARFPDRVAAIHSGLTDREKTNQWWSVIDKKKDILIGARSALFCPIEEVGLIIVDEEHDSSFKQDEKLKYNGRDAAIMLAKLHNCKIVLGSATPSMETWNNALTEKYHLHKMKKRVSERKLPNITVVDLRDERERRKENPNDLPFWLSEVLYEKIKTTLDNQLQVALFLNRRGLAQTVCCLDCGHSFECPNCSINLTLHTKRDLVCHYCDYTSFLDEHCPQCQSSEVTSLGLGTELIENDVKRLFPDFSIARADRDEIQNREDLEGLILNMEERKIDILIGTQMIAKGLDFPGLALIGIVLADVGLNIPDFRASERCFQLFTQVCGRSGRHLSSPGEAIIQTYSPEHTSVVQTKTHDFEQFAKRELEFRRDLKYPPFGKLTSVRITGLDQTQVERIANEFVRRANNLKDFRTPYGDIQILGPTPSAIPKLKNQFRYHVLIKVPQADLNTTFISEMSQDKQQWVPRGVKIQFDIDPINMI